MGVGEVVVPREEQLLGGVLHRENNYLGGNHQGCWLFSRNPCEWGYEKFIPDCSGWLKCGYVIWAGYLIRLFMELIRVFLSVVMIVRLLFKVYYIWPFQNWSLTKIQSIFEPPHQNIKYWFGDIAISSFLGFIGCFLLFFSLCWWWIAWFWRWDIAIFVSSFSQFRSLVRCSSMRLFFSHFFVLGFIFILLTIFTLFIRIFFLHLRMILIFLDVFFLLLLFFGFISSRIPSNWHNGIVFNNNFFLIIQFFLLIWTLFSDIISLIGLIIVSWFFLFLYDLLFWFPLFFGPVRHINLILF